MYVQEVQLPTGVLSAVVQVVIALVASGLAVKLLTIRQDRRKIAGEATAQEANAASTLSGAALQMVEAAQKSAREADVRATAANENAEECRTENNKLWAELNKARWEIHWLNLRERVLEAALRQAGIVVPPAPERLGEIPTDPPPELPSRFGPS